MNTSKESSFWTFRKNAVIAGVLFIIGTVSGTFEASLCVPVLNAPDYLLRIFANLNLITIGAILQFIMAISCAGISLALYPILKKFSESLAVGAVGFRLVENMLQILSAVSMVSLLVLSQEFFRAGSPTNSFFQSAGAIIQTSNDWMNGAALICFSIGAAMYYSVIYQHRLLPRWLSGWGLAGVALVIIGAVLVMLHVIPSFGNVQMVLNLPIFPQEMVFAVWLILKGFNSSAVSSRFAKTAPNELISAA